jgi:glutathione S-transferase
MKLYFSPGACSLSPHIVAREAGLPITLERVSLADKKTASGEDFRAISPKAQVPAVVLDDGELLTEGPAIVQYLADQKPESGLIPKAGTRERYRAIEWLNFITTELHKTYSTLFNRKLSDEPKQLARETLKAKYAIVEKALEGKDYLFGATFSVADAYLYTVTRWAGFVGVDLSDFPTLNAFMARVDARPAVREAHAAESAK